MFGDRGQEILARLTVGVVGAGGAGSLIIEYLSRLGVGALTVIDPDVVEITNLPRLAGARRRDAGLFLDEHWPSSLRRFGSRYARPKIEVGRRVAREANPRLRYAGIRGDVAEADVARTLLDCDYIFLAADTMRARLVVNAITQQYLIPTTQVGAKVTTNADSGNVQNAFAVVRPLPPGGGCLWCNGLIPPADSPRNRRRPTSSARSGT